MNSDEQPLNIETFSMYDLYRVWEIWKKDNAMISNSNL